MSTAAGGGEVSDWDGQHEKQNIQVLLHHFYDKVFVIDTNRKTYFENQNLLARHQRLTANLR